VPVHRPPASPRIIVLLCLVAVLVLFGWISSRLKKDHWDEVARARHYLDRGQPDLAFQAVSRIRDEGPGAAEGLTLGARALLMHGDVSAARRTLERSLSIKLDQPEAAKMLAAIYIAGGDGQRGVAMLKKAALLEPNDFRPWYALGKLYHDMGNLQESAQAYTQALRRSPPAAEARECRGGRARALLDANQAEEAAADLDELRKQTPDDPQVLALAARQARDLGRTDEAERLADRALASDPRNFDALLIRARLRFLSRRPREAIADLEQAVQVRPNDVATLQLLLQSQKSLGLSREAAATQQRADRARERMALIDQLTKVIDQRPDDPEPRWRLGQAAMEGELYVLAHQCFQAALDLDPQFKPARDALEELRSRKGFDYQSAVKLQMRLPGQARPPEPPSGSRR
jgi:tetratricopeptide (TPR) repeat protein